MKKIILFFLTIGVLYGSKYETNMTCKGCHPIIYNEFYNSAHRKSSIFEDTIHNAIWKKHPNSSKNKYDCNECHTPTDTRITDALKNNKIAMPHKDKSQVKEAISCIYCHSIENIEKHAKTHDKNILTLKSKTFFAADKKNRGKKIIFKEETSFFGLFKKISGSPFHNIDYTKKQFYTGKMCMGCHAHFENSHAQNVCKIDETGASNEEQNCITCHMPQIKGSKTTIKISKTHTFHGFAGVRNKPEMLAKYLKIGFKKNNNGFEIIIKNLATHNLLMHPLRLGKLNVKVNNIALKSIPFFRILGKNKKPAMPWVATEVFKNTMLKAKEKRIIHYNTPVTSGDNIEVEFAYFLVNPKMIKKLNLQNSIEANKKFILKIDNFTVK